MKYPGKTTEPNILAIVRQIAEITASDDKQTLEILQLGPVKQRILQWTRLLICGQRKTMKVCANWRKILIVDIYWAPETGHSTFVLQIRTWHTRDRDSASPGASLHQWTSRISISMDNRLLRSMVFLKDSMLCGINPCTSAEPLSGKRRC